MIWCSPPGVEFLEPEHSSVLGWGASIYDLVLPARNRVFALVNHIMYYVYVLISLKKESQIYIGFSSDLRRRLVEHNSGKSKATKPYMPWKLVFYEAFLNKKDAERREMYFKTSKGRKALRLIARDSLIRE